MKYFKSKIMVSLGSVLLVSGASSCGGRTVNEFDETPRVTAASPAAASESPESDAGAGAISKSSSVAPVPVRVARAPACVGVGTACRFDTDCCPGSWCNNLTYAEWTCVAPLPNGRSCTTNDHCQSGICENYACVATSCSGVGTACGVDADCCAGSFCDNQGYGEWQCTPKSPVGGSCTTNQWCQSGRCMDYRCVSP